MVLYLLPSHRNSDLLDDDSNSVFSRFRRNKMRDEGSDATSNKAANDEHDNFAC